MERRRLLVAGLVVAAVVAVVVLVITLAGELFTAACKCSSAGRGTACALLPRSGAH